MKGLVLIGIGNPLRGDDAIGARVVAASSDRFEKQMLSGEASQLVAVLKDARGVILCDALVVDDTPGVVRTLDCRDPLPMGCLPCSSHAFGVAEGIELARSLGVLPEFCHIVGVVASDFEIGGPLSPALTAAIPVAVARIEALVAGSAFA